MRRVETQMAVLSTMSVERWAQSSIWPPCIPQLATIHILTQLIRTPYSVHAIMVHSIGSWRPVEFSQEPGERQPWADEGLSLGYLVNDLAMQRAREVEQAVEKKNRTFQVSP